MLRRAVLAGFLTAIAVLVGVSSAQGANVYYFVTGYGDTGGACAPYPNIPGAMACDTLRAAVAAAGADADEDFIYLQPGTYSLVTPLTLTTSVAIFGGNARTTVIQGGSAGRLFDIAAGTTVTLYGMTLQGGNVTDDDGGGIRNAGDLLLFEARVTNNRAVRGGGIANTATGTLDVIYSLIDNNHGSEQISGPGTGGGIFNQGALGISDSTIALNSANSVGGINSLSAQTSQLTHVTLAGNVATGDTNPGGVSFTGLWSSDGSLFLRNDGDNLPSNCGSAQTGGTGNIEDGSDCGFTTSTGLAATVQLVDRGGMTDVVDIAGTTAKDFDQTCSSAFDQRRGQRTIQQPCDAGAYEEGVPAGPIQPLFTLPTATATPTTGPTPTPTATVTPTPTPVAGKQVVVKTIKGTVKIRLPGTDTFIELDGTKGIPVGATVDTKKGTVQLTSLQKKGGKPQTAKFFEGIFKLGQTKTTTDLTLTEKLAACPKRARKASAAARKKPKARHLWGDGKGAFRTRGQYSAATVRGTTWFVQDSCAGTLTRVKRGVVSVRDNVRRKTIVVRGGNRYLAKPRR